jgi:pyruvate kinase
MSPLEPVANRSRTKIVATVGPACRDPKILRQMVGAGVDVFRLNMAHGTRAEHEQFLATIRAAEADAHRPLAVLVDLAGPKIRLGTVTPDPLPCPLDAEFRFVRDSTASPNDLTCNYERLVDELSVNDRVLLADGTVEMIVTQKSADAVTCRVVGPGSVRSRQGVNLPGAKLSVPAMTVDDLANADWAIQQQADYISLSFVRSPADIAQLRDRITQAGSQALTIAKIEKPEAIDCLEEIVRKADGIMVARGDLGVEMDVAEIPVKQKWIVEMCRRWKKPVIVATQMLDSMQHTNRPTRAEATDVANAVLDGADAGMLSGETAVGDYPVESVRMMNRIMMFTERSLESSPSRQTAGPVSRDLTDPITSAIVAAAGQVAAQLQAKLVVIATRSGKTALIKAKQRDFVPTVAVSDQQTTLRQTCLFWGIVPLAGVPDELDRDLVRFIDNWGHQQDILHQHDFVVFVAGNQIIGGVHNRLWVHQLS